MSSDDLVNQAKAEAESFFKTVKEKVEKVRYKAPIDDFFFPLPHPNQVVMRGRESED